jgi:hypothetical protein
MQIILAIVLVAAVFALAYYLKRRGSADNKPFWHKTTLARALTLIRGDKPIVTVDGHKIFHEPGLITSTDLHAIDYGVERAFRKAECAGYPVDRSRHNVQVVVLASEKAPLSGDPSFRVAIWPPLFGEPSYYNTEYDQMKGSEEYVHYLLAGGETVAFGNPYGDIIVVPFCLEEEKEYLARVVEYEMEHVVLAYYDGVKYEATKTHLTGGHPLMDECTDAFRLVPEVHRNIECSGSSQ